MTIEESMYQQVTDFICKRYPKGWGGAAIVRTEEDHYYISVALEAFNASVEVCMETGAMIEATKYHEKITHCLCVVRDDETTDFKVLSPCGVCQERLRYWGTGVKVAVTTPNHQLKFVTLGEMTPYHWTTAYAADDLESYDQQHKL